MLPLVKVDVIIDLDYLNSHKEEKKDTEFYSDDRFKEERRKKFKEYKAGIGVIFFVLFISLLAIGIGQVLIIIFQVIWKRTIYKNKDLMRISSSRWFYFAATVSYLTAITESKSIYNDDETLFLEYLSKNFDVEDELNELVTSYPSNQKRYIDMITVTPNSDNCPRYYAMNFIDTNLFTMEQCRGIASGIVNYGEK